MKDYQTITRLRAKEKAQKIASKELSPLQAVEAYIEAIERINPRLNAVVFERFEKARTEARAAQEKLANKKFSPPPLFAVPCTVKESFAVQGVPQTSGVVARRRHVATEDAIAVGRIRAAGAIVVGVTNVSQLCLWMESDNRVYGRTNNPYDQTRIVGGSSGGEGAIVGAGASVFGVGADIGGSIRMPAFFNGVFGHKPSSGLIPNQGQYPLARGEGLKYLTTGPIARYATDLPLLVDLMAGTDLYRDCEPLRTQELKRLTVYQVRDSGLFPIAPELVAAQEAAAGKLEEAGAKVIPLQLEALKRSAAIWMAMLSASETPDFIDLLREEAPFEILDEVLKLALKRSDHTLPAVGLAVFEAMTKPLMRFRSGLINEGLRLREELTGLLREDAVMLYPSYTRPAPRHGQPLRIPIQWMHTAIFNVMELPVTQVPLGLNHEGLPLGVQVASAHGNDPLTIRVAIFLEEAFGGWVPPPE